MDVRSGVPHESVLLGPLLFLLFSIIYLLMLFLNVSFFAGDLKIYLKIQHSKIVDMSCCQRNINTIVHWILFDSSCQRDINTIVHVASYWRMQINVEKCCVMRFASKKSSIERLDLTRQIRFLPKKKE